MRFSYLDANSDGRVSQPEWHADLVQFGWLDRNRDGVLTRDELAADDTAPADLVASLDMNRDGRVVLNEWHWSRAAFDRRDTNHDGSLSRDELTIAVGTSGQHTRAYQSGFDRRLDDRRKAGREDKQLRNRWDLDGQRELEHADAGYTADVESRGEYQAGFREEFTRGYREGFGPR